ncbi:glycine betaine ABC transporter substrate-binding protein [Georgenia subflava]|uniref:Glycine/betaine ABC transporter substrate-binding protein n=1 Tax=Georgenia subflava TaxID=1622177 RepID=A0A6N7EMG4_9MICO|nr:glycine betaine ABC transporter substrate-binding protein [Georgenia subflava]MPV38057.1 glycine/betaine ABC transporter substrate-binding protein [Georgenia subflava]
MQSSTRRGAIIATTTALALTLAACGTGGGDSTGDSTDSAETAAEGAAPEDAEPITIGMFNWDEAIAASYLWEHILTEAGYEVSIETADPAVVFAGTASGEYDVNFDTWMPAMHADYVGEFGDDMEDLGMWMEGATPAAIAVNEDAPIDSLAELAENADLFGNRIVGIEAGAALTAMTNESIIPGYGLEGMEFVTSSTPAMLAELQAATEAGENIVVTLWAPHWAYDAYPIKDLEDPEGTFPEADNVHTYGHAGFSEEYPQVAEWIGNFTMSQDQLAELENVMFNEFEGEDHEAAIDQWVETNPDFVEGIIGAA